MLATTENHFSAYFTVDGDIPIDLADGTFVSVNRLTTPKIYQLGFQPAKSIPEIPRWFLEKYAQSRFAILEPFAGAGTTIIEGLRHGVRVYWLDYHPLSRLICRVKTSVFLCQEVMEETARIIARASRQKSAPETVNFANKNFWFQQPVQEGLEILREHIQQAKIHVQPILWLAFASTVRKTSDMNDGMLLAAKRSHIKIIPRRSRADVFAYFRSYIDKALEAVDEWNTIVNGSRYDAV